MAQTKQTKQMKALERLVASLGDDLSAGRTIPLAKRMEYNALKAALGQKERI